jgi:hypothetical protein
MGIALQFSLIRIGRRQSMLSTSRALKKRCVITVSGVHADKFSKTGLDCGAQIMVTYVKRFIAILSRLGSTRHALICQIGSG